MPNFESDLSPGQGDRASFPFLTSKSLAKTVARQDFFQLLNSVEREPTALIISDRGKDVAVIIGIKQYQAMLDLVQKHAPSPQKDPLAGLVTHLGDLEKDSEKVKSLFEKSIAKTSSEFK